MVEYNKDRPLKVATAFSGYDSQKMALERLHNAFPDFCFELVAWSEIDENAIAAHNAIFPEDKSKNLGDISKIDWAKAPDFDLFTYSFPCQDISAAGKQSGFEEGTGTRSSLLWECKKTIEAKKPRYLMMENVKALASAKFLPFLRQWQRWLHGQGYENFTQILNACDYEVPQNRERVFMISILRTDNNPYPSYYFPKKLKLEKRIKHILEQNVDESYYLSQKALEYFCRTNNGLNGSDESSCIGRLSNSQDGVVSGVNAIAPTLCAGHANQPKVLFFKQAAEPKIAASRGRGEFNRQQLEINESGTSNTLTSVSKDNLLIEPKVNIVGQYDSSQNSRIIDTEGISYCVTNGHKDGMPKIIEPNVLRQERTEQGKQIRKLSKGDKGIKFNAGNKEFCPRTDGLSNTLSTSTKDNMLAVPELRCIEGCMVDKYGNRYRVRKLTPKECFRLMDVSDEDIKKMESSGVAKTNLYKLAGNSIVVACMFHIFRKLFVERGNENPQLELF